MIASPMGRVSVFLSFGRCFSSSTSRGGLASGSFFCTVAETPPREIQQQWGCAALVLSGKRLRPTEHTHRSSMHRHQSFDSQGEPIEYCCE